MCLEKLPQPRDWLPRRQTTSRMNTISAYLSAVEPSAMNALLNDVTRLCVAGHLELAEINVPYPILTALTEEPLDVLGSGKFHGVSFGSTSGTAKGYSFELKFSACPQSLHTASTGAARMRAKVSAQTLPAPGAWLPKASMRKWLRNMSIDIGGARLHALKSFLDHAIVVCRRRGFTLLSVGLPGPFVPALTGELLVPSVVFGDYGGVGLYGQDLYPMASILEFNFAPHTAAVS